MPSWRAWTTGKVICDALYLPQIRAELLQLAGGKVGNRSRVRLAGSFGTNIDPEKMQAALASSRLVASEQANTSIIFGDVAVSEVLPEI